MDWAVEVGMMMALELVSNFSIQDEREGRSTPPSR